MTAVGLGRASLRRLPPSIRAPSYDPARVTPGIVHLGPGAFHRAHMARYTHELMERDPAALGWGITGAGLLPADRRIRDALAPQDWLYTLVERDGATERAAVIGSLAGIVLAGDVLDPIHRPETRIVSLTVSENGYCLNPATRELDPGHPAIRRDLATPEAPVSAPGVLVEALRRRRDAGLGAFTALSCDNIQDNGKVLEAAVLALARLRDPALADWIAANAAFPGTMVDRITPATRPDHLAHLEAAHGLRDAWPVFAEDFSQWVVEDRFAAGRPAWEEVGAQFVPDVAPYEMMKLRLLNASHLAIAALGRLLGHTHVHAAMREPLLAAYMVALMERELSPPLPPVPGIDLPAYRRRLVARFANPAIEDTVERINRDAPLNLLLVPIEASLAAGGDVDLLALGLAAWMRRALGTDEAGARIELGHPMAALLMERAAEGRGDPRPLLSIAPLFGRLGEQEGLVAPLRRWLASLYAAGSAATLERAARELRFG